MKYSADSNGCFNGQQGYGYVSFERFVEAVNLINMGQKKVQDFDHLLPTVNSCQMQTAILEAGRISLDHNGSIVLIDYDKQYNPILIKIKS